MLIRATKDSSFECILQEHHAVLSGTLAAAWGASRLDPLLVQAIGLHDNPWRAADANPQLDAERGLPHDFITYPMRDKIELYRTGIDALEAVHPWIAHLVSRHYTTFSGTRDIQELQEPEQARRKRLAAALPAHRLDAAKEALAWVKFFDIFSLHLCLTGPAAKPATIPRWLADPDAWSTAPDDTTVQLRWHDDTTLHVEPWPFADPELALELYYRRLDGRSEGPKDFLERWEHAPLCRRTVTIEAPRGTTHEFAPPDNA